MSSADDSNNITDGSSESFSPFDEPIISSGPVFKLATWHQRVAAAFIDIFFIWLILFIGLTISGEQQSQGSINQIANLLGFLFFVWQQWMQGITGKTIGKRVLRLKLIRAEDAELLGGPMSVVRGLLHILDGALCFIGFILPAWDKKRQTFADKIVKSVVIHEGF